MLSFISTDISENSFILIYFASSGHSQ